MFVIESQCCCNQQGKYSLNEFGGSGQVMIMSKHNLITFSLCSSSSYNLIDFQSIITQLFT